MNQFEYLQNQLTKVSEMIDTYMQYGAPISLIKSYLTQYQMSCLQDYYDYCVLGYERIYFKHAQLIDQLLF